MSIDPSLDPVEDFLVNRKEGHCEYFASALALLLRSIDIPSRMVNGFKGGDWNELTQTMNVRQKHAHSWVEAYAGLGRRIGSRSGSPSIRLPSTERQESIAQVGGLAGNFRPLTDLIRHIWVFYIVGYDGDRQDRLLYTPDAPDDRSRCARSTSSSARCSGAGLPVCSISETSAPSSVFAGSSSRSSS